MMTADCFLLCLQKGISPKVKMFKTVFMMLSWTFVYCMDTRNKEIILRTHNNFRRFFANGRYGVSASNMRKLEWSVELQLQSELMLNCGLITSQTSNPFDTITNVGVTADGNITHILHTWMTEKQNFIRQLETCIHLQECKRFLTMIHARHHAIGCAFTNQCRVKNDFIGLLVCKYGGSDDPIVPAFKPGAPCTKCEGDSSFCDGGLCVPCTGSRENCDCRKTCLRENIGYGTLNNETCTCQCSYGLGPNCDEDCVNPEMYVDMDICALITNEDCQTTDPTERAILREMCPVQCSCRRHPDAAVRSDHQPLQIG